MPDDSRLNQQFETLYAAQHAAMRDDALAEVRCLGAEAERLFVAISDAGIHHRDYDDIFQSAVETMRNAWDDARSDLVSNIRNAT